MASLFRRLIAMKPIWTLALSLAVVVLSSIAFSIIETWSVATFLKPDLELAPSTYLGAILLDFTLLAAWAALYYGINYFLLLEDQIACASGSKARRRARNWRCFATNSTRTSCSTRSTRSRPWYCSSRPSARTRCSPDCHRSCATPWPTSRPRKVTLAQEVETLKLYLEIEKMRFEDRLRPHFKVDAETIGARLPSLLLQPLIENAIKYAVTASENGADIWITAVREGHAVRIEVADNGSGEGGDLAASPSTGVGLANIRDRLTQAYGPAHGFTTRENDKGGFSVIIEIPYETGDQDT